MNTILFDGSCRPHLFPLTLTRPISSIRVGILTIREKWEILLEQNLSILTAPYLQEKYPCTAMDDNLIINASLLPNSSIIEKITSLQKGEALLTREHLIAARIDAQGLQDLALNFENNTSLSTMPSFTREILLDVSTITMIGRPFDIFSFNHVELIADYKRLTDDRKSMPLPDDNLIIGNRADLFIELGAIVHGATINTTGGPVYIGKNAVVMEGSCIQGPVSIGEGSTVKLGCKIYGETTIGPFCKVGGELSNVVFFGYSNKAHDGYLGNAVIGEWCNVGAGSNFSNLQNNYKNVPLWSYPSQNFIDTGLQFCGIIMGDHTRCSINSMFNTGTVTGICCNLFGAGFHKKFIPSFSFGGKETGYRSYLLEKSIETAGIVYSRRGLLFSETEKNILRYIAENENPI